MAVKWCFEIKGKHRDGEPKSTRPDVDNMTKMFLDCCTKTGFWTDDSLVVSLIIEKFYATIPGVYVHIEEL